MVMYGHRNWCGESRSFYRFNILLTDRNIPAKGGVYVFVRRRFIFFLEPIYVGKAANLKSRLKKHERWGEAYWDLGATEKHILLVKDETNRRKVEEDLIRRLKPPLNKMLSPRGTNDAPKHKDLLKRWSRRNYWKRSN